MNFDPQLLNNHNKIKSFNHFSHTNGNESNMNYSMSGNNNNNDNKSNNHKSNNHKSKVKINTVFSGREF